jgi:putative ABC transport system substrate-binding protein
VEGETVIVERRSWEGHPERAPALLAELVRLKVDVLVVAGSRLVTVAKQATTTIPIVMVAGGDPVTTGLIASFARPGGNLTGLTVHHPELSGKTLELLKETLPHLSRVAALWEVRGDPAAVRQMERAAQALGLSLQVLTVRAPDEFPRAFQAAIEGYAEALHLSESAMLDAHLPQLAAFAAQRRLPTMGQLRLSAEAGFLMSYGPDIADLFRRAATYVEKILHGAKPEDLPVERPTKFELDVYFTSPAPVCSLLGARASSPLLTQARRLRSQGTGSAFTKQTSSDQPQDCQGAWDHDTLEHPFPGGSGDPVGEGRGPERGRGTGRREYNHGVSSKV